MKYKVIKMHRSEFPNPMTFSKGDKLIIGEKSDEHEAWKGWYFCETQNQIKGWVPEQVIKLLDNNIGIALEDYTAFELDVNVGDELIGIRILNGWIWCQQPSKNIKGWVPLENLHSATEN